MKSLLLGHLDRAIYLTVDIFDTREICDREIQPFVRDSIPFPEGWPGPEGNSPTQGAISTWFQHPHLKRSHRSTPWIYHCPIAPALAPALGWPDAGALALAIAKAMEMSIPENHPILRSLSISVEAGAWLALDVQSVGVEAWLAEMSFEDPPPRSVANNVLAGSTMPSAYPLEPCQLWVCQHHHARLNRQQNSPNRDLLAGEWDLLGVFLDTIDAITCSTRPLEAPQALKLAQTLVKASAAAWDRHSPTRLTIPSTKTHLQAKTQQLLAVLLVEYCGQQAPSHL